MLHPTKEFGTVYRKLLGDLLDKNVAAVEFNERTKTNVAVLPGAQAFQLDLGDNRLPTCGLRRIHPRTAAAEVAWFLRGDRKSEWLEEREVKIWKPFAESDGTVKNAYGYRWRSHFGRDQIGKAVSTLKQNPTDRQCYISAWDPGSDGLGNKGKNFPCPVGFSFTITDRKLHSTLLLRSSDVFVGLPYDVMGHAMLMAIVAHWIEPDRLTLGTMSVTLAHAHMYDAHWDMAKGCLSRSIVKSDIPLITIPQERSDWDYWINEYALAGKHAYHWPDYNPRPGLIL